MGRACALFFMVCFASHAIAEGRQPEQPASLQIGGPLRIIEKKPDAGPEDTGELAESRKDVSEAEGAIEPSESILPANPQLLAGLDLDQVQDPSLDYSLTGSVSVGIGYSFIEAEDLATDRAADGLIDVDHQSHHLLFRALWHFE